MRKKLKFLLSVNWIKTIYFNFKKFPISIARKLPVYFYGDVKLTCITGAIKIDAPIKRAMIGFGQAYEKTTRSKGIAEFFVTGTLCFKGHAQFGKDCFLYVSNQGYCEFGHMASMASNGKIFCYNSVILGDWARIGSESQLIDTNFHQMINTETGESYPMTGKIYLGDYNFVSNRVTILQKTKTPAYCTIASNTLCSKDYSDLGSNIMIGGIPAKLLKENISRDWEGERQMIEAALIISK